MEENVSDEKLGLLAYQLNELSYDISTSELGIDDVEKATEAVITKILTRHVGDDLSISFDLSGATVSDITTQLFNNEAIASNIDLLLTEFENSASEGLLSLLDKPQMMTPLWAHQRDALEKWWEQDQRGYVDMATATGKTVLGLSAIALQYGELHPDDQAIGEVVTDSDSGGNDDVLIVAHSDLILEQWRREFENHLNIPQERTTGSNDITLEWGTIHFRTPQSLVNEDRVAYDLVLLDEAHHYATGSEWGSLLDEFDGDILAMSGSVDDAGSDSDRIKERLSNSIGPEIKRYTITDARAAGVIPSFDWEVHYAPYDVVGDDLENTTTRAERSFRDFQMRLIRGELSLDTERRLKTYEDVRQFSHTKEGNTLKQQDETFRDLVTQLFSRRTKQWNLSPVLDAVVDLVTEHHTTEKVVVLADSNTQVEELESRLNTIVNPSSLYLVSGSQSREEQRETIDKFDESEGAGILLGTGDLLGEGVDMQHASVAINMATGGVNQELVQRIGRVLRNPADTPKHAMFYNVVGVSPTEAAATPREDGKQLLEQAAGFCSLGRRFNKLPGFATSTQLNNDVVETLLDEGAQFIDSLDANSEYDWEKEIINQADLTALHYAIQDNRGDLETILGEWEEYAWEHSEETDDVTVAGDSDESTDTTDEGGNEVSSTNSEETLTATKRERIEDIVHLQPTKNATLQSKWMLSSGREVHEYLQSELTEYYFRDGDSLIWASDEAEAVVNSGSTDSIENEQSDAEPSKQTTQQPSEDDLLDEIRRLMDDLGETPTKEEMRYRGGYEVSQYENVFGSWSDAVREAGYEPHGSQKSKFTRDDVLSGLREVALTLDKSPSVNDVNEHAPFSATVVYNHFDSIGEARQAAGVNQLDDNEAAMTDRESTPTSDGDDSSTNTNTPEKSAETTTETDPEEDDEEAEPNPETDDGTVEQIIFWDQDVEQITDFEANESVVESSTTNGDELDNKIDEWKSQLLDLTRRNKLVSFKPTKSKSLPFKETNPTTVADELDDGELHLRKQPTDETEDVQPDLGPNELLPTRPPDEAANSLSQIGRKNKQHLRERGVDSLYISLGMLRWYSVDYSDEANRSPLFLAPVELEEKTIQDGEKHDYVLKPKADGIRLNPALRKKLAAERGISLPVDSALSLEEIDAAFEAVYETLSGFNRWTIQSDVVLGIFDFTKFSLYSDLERNRDAIKDNPIIQALNGEMEPIQNAEGDITTPSTSELDDAVDPIDTYQVLDADSSQQEAIEAAKRGKSFALQGPPGTGKSQTIANIIAEKIAAGERVLFVSEKQAALDVVKNRLDDVGLGRFCLEVHGEKAANTAVLGNLETELQAPQIKPADDRAKRLRKLRERRETINQYGQHLFYSPEGWNLTAYQAFGIVSEHADAPRIDIGITQPLSVEQETLESAVDELVTLARFDDEINTYETSPWRHTTLRQWGVDTGDSMRQSLDRQVEAIEMLQDVADELKTELGVRPESVADLREMKQLLDYVSNRPDIAWQEAFFDGSFSQAGGRFEDLADLEQERESLIYDLSDHYQRSFFSANGADLNNELAAYGMLKVVKPSYRSLKRKVTTHTQESYDPSHDQLLEDTRKLAEVQRIEDRREDFRGIIQRLGPLYEGGDTDWETLSQAQRWVAGLDKYESTFTDPIIESLVDNTLPSVGQLLERADAALADYDDAATFFENSMNVQKMRVNSNSFRKASFPDLSETLRTLRGDVPALQRRVQFASQLETVRETICEEYVERFLQGDYSSDHLVPAFKKRFYTQWLNSVYEQTGLGSFNTDKMERYVEEFRRLDKEQQELAKIEVQHEVTKRRPSLDLEHASSAEQVLVRREAEKQRKHKPLRELFDEAGSFITQLTPCFMMSPLSVAQHLKADSIQFDTVVFDEASQIMPQDAVSSLIRADQAIIAGDTNQLPPTSFFQSDVETTEDVREDLDSILEETASVLPEKNLKWHYRSRTEELIQFSNHHYYNNSLRTFPENDPDVETGVSFEYVEDGVYDRGGSRQNEIEAQRVIDLIEDHADERSDKSLGVVAFSSAQEQAIRDALAERREENPVLDAFVSQDDVLDEFFIKNLEMVQGDERDRMIFSVGYGPAQDGTISTNFGPINKSGGERRLNVAVTRAKEQVTVVCSMLPGDIDLSGSNSTGAKHFKNYLEYARKGEQALARNDHVTDTLDFDSQFEEAVYEALEAEGHDVVSQVQSSGYSIDLAIKHPEQPGKFILGIECDGAAYHSSKTARDRDRTRQMVLEDLGWTIHRIWSPDWTSNQEAQIQAINDKVDSLIAENSTATSTTDVPTHEPDAVPSKSKLDHEALTEYVEPSLEWNDRYSVDKRGQSTANRNAVHDTVKQHGPIKSDTAIQTYLDVWSQSRAGKRVQRAFNSGVDTLTNKNKIYQRGEFLWPQRRDLDFKVRVNTDSATRSIDEISKEELAKAIAVLLQEGGRMTRDDVILETTRLIGYKRRGKRIEKRVGDATDLLDDAGAIEVDEDEKLNLQPDVDIDETLLNRIY
ncbi:DUF5797 family protein [Halobacterium salinarum]|uniref:DUF5797 family protein n=1 Tax=Halobacterium salinarum TaxID=2242 RepID=UPI0025555013|nr:DUF5797 family protein [Halobacterium salinarum]MDL0130960.1 DUF5797 family protein [Halobacterium salinarum]